MTDQNVNIEGLERADVLATIYNVSAPCGMGFIQYRPQMMDREAAEALLAQSNHFDYIQGRPVKLELPEGVTSINPIALDRTGYVGFTEMVIDMLRSTKDPTHSAFRALHHVVLLDAIRGAEEIAGTPPSSEVVDGIPVFDIGMADPPELRAGIERAKRELGVPA